VYIGAEHEIVHISKDVKKIHICEYPQIKLTLGRKLILKIDTCE